MKTVGFVVIILTAVTVSSVLFVLKFRNQHLPLDEIKSSLGNLRVILHANNVIGCVSYTQDPETVDQVGSVMAPTSVVPNGRTQDTVLFVFRPAANDSVLRSLMPDKLVVWRSHSERYLFLLTINSRCD